MGKHNNNYRGNSNHGGSNADNNTTGKFEGSIPKLKGYYYTYDENTGSSSVDHYQRTKGKIIEHCCSYMHQA